MHRPVPSPAMLVACTALAISLGGSAYAVTALPRNSVGERQIRANAVKSSEIASRAVGASEIRPGAVGAAQLAGGAVGTSALKLDAVTSNRIADGSVGREDLAAGAVTGDRVRADALGGAQIDESSLGRVPDAGALGGVAATEFQRNLTIVVRRKVGADVTAAGPIQQVVVARCRPGERALGGGGFADGANAARATIHRTVPVRPVDDEADAAVQPSAEGEIATGWLVMGTKDAIAGGTPGTMRFWAYVICAA